MIWIFHFKMNVRNNKKQVTEIRGLLNQLPALFYLLFQIVEQVTNDYGMPEQDVLFNYFNL